jgi:hypothetical protein
LLTPPHYLFNWISLPTGQVNFYQKIKERI